MSRPEVEIRAAALRAERVPFVHATVVLADRPTSAKPGDEAIVFADGTIEGFVGGTCAESTVRAQGLRLLDSGEPLLLRITPSPEDDEAWAGAGDHTDRLAVHNPCLSGGTLEIFLEPVIPAPLLVVHGDSPIAHALMRLGERLDYQVSTTVGEAQPVGALPEPDLAAVPGAGAVVCASHGRDEEPVLEAALQSEVPYVALVASPKRGQDVVASLDVDEAARSRVHTPAGLDIGARTPEEVALSVLAEIVAERRRASGRPVSEEHHHHDHHAGRVEHPDSHTVHAGPPDEHAGHLGRVEHPDRHGEHVGHPHTEHPQGRHDEHGHAGRDERGDVAPTQNHHDRGEAAPSHDHETPGQQHADDAHHGHRAAGEATARPGTALDPVCGMTVATVEASLHLDHEGVRYWFCGTGCLRAFAADPARYLDS